MNPIVQYRDEFVGEITAGTSVAHTQFYAVNGIDVPNA